jgi:hypothetical protein
MQLQKTQPKQMQPNDAEYKADAASGHHNSSSNWSQHKKPIQPINAIAAAADDATKGRREIDQTQ